ncbi:MAG TPA: alkaline phosphatase family protein, partial [Gemmatimonadales bacterium]|nr:alkaline phosphatase family protein [Gemmatimonadales bacterium]
ALLARGDSLLVANGKGRGSASNQADGPGPGPGRPPRAPGSTLSQLRGTLSFLSLHGLDSAVLAAFSARVRRANGWDRSLGQPAYPPFEHVVYIIKENRTYDQVLGDLRQADGDSSLTFFPRAVTPNHHALAERFGIFDRFFVNAEVSADGHNWSTAAYATDYVTKTLPQNYSGRGRSYDYEGTNRGVLPPPGEDAAEPAQGYLWDLARRRNITFRNFGEFVTGVKNEGPIPAGYVGLKPFLEAHTDSTYPGFDLDIPDQHRADLWLLALGRWQQEGRMPALQILKLPNDHTAAAREGALTPRAYMADNDLALGRIVEGLSRSAFWKNTVVLVVEDDAQNGPDHVDSHRAPFLVISAWNQSRVWHRFTNTTDVIATIEELLTLDHLSQFDAFGRPLRGIFAASPDLTPYTAALPEWPLTELNARNAPGARESRQLDLRFEDLGDDELFNRALWLALKGTARPYPGASVMTPALLKP